MCIRDSVIVDNTDDEMCIEDDLPIFIPRLVLKDYGYQNGADLHCCFKYIAVVYDQMCECIDSYGQEDKITRCDGTFENLGLINLGNSDFMNLLRDVNFEFDSDLDYDFSLIAKQLQSTLASWCKKISRVKLNTDFAYQTTLDLYDSEIITEIMSRIHLHDKSITKSQLEGLKYSVLEIEVVFDDLQYFNLKEIGLNLTYCNYLIYKFLQNTYYSCGFYLNSYPLKQTDVPFYSGKTPKSSYCHLYLIPLNLKRFYYDYGKRGGQAVPLNPLARGADSVVHS